MLDEQGVIAERLADPRSLTVEPSRPLRVRFHERHRPVESFQRSNRYRDKVKLGR